MDFSSLLSRAASNDPSLVGLAINRGTRGIPENRAEIVKRVMAALATSTHVKRLEIADLRLTEADIAPLAQLLKTRDFEQLNLHGNKLTGEILFPALAARNSLRVLNLSCNESLTALEHLSALNSLEELDLHSCGLSAVPPAVLQMPHLEVLNLSGNLLKTLPASFASLSNLKQLDVGGCGFSEIPAVLLSVTKLEYLNINENDQLTSIPDGIAALVSLKVLDASRCDLEEFPIAVTQLARLEELGLGNNSDIDRVPEEIGNLRSLKVLNLFDCGLTEVPGALWTLAHLETLILRWNPLTSLPGGIGALSKLKRLDLSECPITKLPIEMQQLSSLEVLDIEYTKITHLPVWLALLPSLKELRCYRCPLVGVAVNEDTLVTFGELAALVSHSSDPEAVGKLQQSFEEMGEESPLRLLRITNMHFAPRTPLRALCVSKCVAQHSRVDLQRLPAHIRDEIARAAGVVEREEATKAPKRTRQEEEEEEERPHKRARAE